MKVGIYIRVSTEEQAKEGYSISAQKQKLIAFCNSQEWELQSVYVDEGISAKDMNRPQLQQMIKDIKDGQIECVLVYRLDRLTRSVLDLYTLLQTFDKYGCKFKSSTEVFETTTAIGRMFITIVAAMAQWERENMGERIALGFAEKVRQGKYALNFRPIGYNLDLKTGKLTINEDEAQIIKLIYKMYIDGYGGNRICKYLNSQGITTKAGNKWNNKPLMEILKNPLYKGYLKWNDEVVEGLHDHIIQPDVFDKVQELIASRKTAEPRIVSSEYIFSGKIKCPSCGHALVGYRAYAVLASGEKVSYKNYRCMKKKLGECEGCRSISEKNMQEAFLRLIEKMDYDLIAKKAYEEKKSQTKIESQSELEIDLIHRELSKIEKRKKKWQYAWSDDEMPYEDFKKRMKEAAVEEERLKLQLDKIQVDDRVNTSEYSMADVMDALKKIKKNWDKLSDMQKKNLIDKIIAKIEIDFINGKPVVVDVEYR
ncbi:recombinase family protein [Bacillus infantis]|uniref:recombinase family protein n=1 Tax=Bacillus infantis TaxID=324767 RepID=UPI003CF0EA1F